MSPRVMPENRIADIIRAAADVFIQKGYRLAQMEEIAKRASVSKATIYYYFKSKVHLFYHMLENGVPADGATAAQPSATPPKTERELLHLLEKRLEERSRLTYLSGLLEGEPADVDLEAEVGKIVEELWDVCERNRIQIVVLEKSAFEFPELAEVYDKYARRRLLRQLERYVESRIRLGAIRPLNSVRAMARIIMESLAWFGFKQLGMGPALRYSKSETLPDLVSVFVSGLKK